MPISGNDFERTGREPGALLADFLKVNYRDAFSLDELAGAMELMGKNMTREELETLLSSLEYGGKVESKVVDCVTYYRYTKVMGLRLI
jgi:hypothetical protein